MTERIESNAGYFLAGGYRLAHQYVLRAEVR